jgi:hypothetical protein
MKMKRCYTDDLDLEMGIEQESKRFRMDERGGYVGVWIKIYQKIKSRLNVALRPKL